jgi:hypothetical protein
MTSPFESVVPQSAEWQRIGDYIDAAMISTGSGEDVVSDAASASV